MMNYQKISLFFLFLTLFFSCDTGGDPLGDALLEAAAQGKIDQMKVCVDNGVDINYVNPNLLSTQMTACSKAAAKGQLAALKWLVAQQADWHKPTAGGENPITYAAKNKHFDIVFYLIEVGEKVNYQETNYGMNAFMYAAAQGNVEALKQLLTLGADIGLTNKENKSALNIAVAAYQLAATNYLVQSAKMPLNKYHLFDAVDTEFTRRNQKQLDMVELLLRLGLDVNAQDGDGNTPLHKAYQYENSDLIRFLKAKAADESIKNSRGMTPRQVRGELVDDEEDAL